jgi:hypothetical protein
VRPHDARRPQVLIAGGGGVAAVEALLALRVHVGHMVAVELLAPEDEFVYRPSSVAEAFGRGEARRFSLTRLFDETWGGCTARTAGSRRSRSTTRPIVARKTGVRPPVVWSIGIVSAVARGDAGLNYSVASNRQSYSRRVVRALLERSYANPVGRKSPGQAAGEGYVIELRSERGRSHPIG